MLVVRFTYVIGLEKEIKKSKLLQSRSRLEDGHRTSNSIYVGSNPTYGVVACYFNAMLLLSRICQDSIKSGTLCL